MGAAMFLLLLLYTVVMVTCDPPPQWAEPHDAPLSHLVVAGGRLYVGGVDHLYQLTSDLQLEAQVSTGPHLDSPECLPPIEPSDCPSATPTHNHNKLLLLEAGPEGAGPGSLIVCGSLFQGICDKRSLSNVSQLVYQTLNPVDTQYVAANDPRVSTVAVVITTRQEGSGALRLMLVGRGYTSKGPGDIPPITTRRLSPAEPPRRAFSQEEDLGKLVVGSYSEYNNHFVAAVSHGDHVYFLFSRRHRKEYRSFVSRLCQSDRSFYSYVEVPLLCGGGHNLAQAAMLGELSGPAPSGSALFVVMAAGQASTPVATGRSALCVYGMAALDAMMLRAQEVCYTEGGGNGGEEAYIEYAVSSKCLKLPKGSLSEPCQRLPVRVPLRGGTHPSPSPARLPLEATPTFTSDTQLTAVTTATEAGRTIAFLGDREGLFVLVDSGSPISADLLLDESQQHVYVLTSRRLSKVPVSSWTRTVAGVSWRGVCSSAEPAAGQSEQRPANRAAIVTGTSITCQSPAPELLPPMLTESDHMILPVSVMFGHVTVTTGNMTFYDCGAVSRLHQNSIWCPLDQICTHNQSCSTHTIQRAPSCPLVFSLQSSALVPLGLSSRLVLRGRNLDLFTDEAQFVCVVEIEGVQLNLTAAVEKTHNNTHTFTCSAHKYAVSQLQYSAAVYLRRGERRIDASPGLRLQLYDCSAGQSDCSQCRAVPPEYGCVWCSGSPAPAVFTTNRAAAFLQTPCPPPQITQGGVLVTITGSNLGMKYQDVVGGVTVAGVQCPPLPEGYQISTRIVCELQASGGPRRGRSGYRGNNSTWPVLPDVHLSGPPAGAGLWRNQTHHQGAEPADGQRADLRAFLGPALLHAERTVANASFRYLDDPVITDASPAESFYAGGRVVMVTGRNLGVVQQPIIAVWVEPVEGQRVKRRRRLALLSAKQQLVFNSSMTTEPCLTVTVGTVSDCNRTVSECNRRNRVTVSDCNQVKVKGVWFQLDNVRVHFETIK
ncbi:Plexin-B1, partial [Dissostichus eleginoides]